MKKLPLIGAAAPNTSPSAPARALPLCIERGSPSAPPPGESPVKQWVKCGSPHKPLGEIVCSCKGCGSFCRDYTIAAPDRVRRIVAPSTLPGQRVFNGSVIRHMGKLLMAYRSGWYGLGEDAPSVRIANLSDTFEVLASYLYKPAVPSVSCGAEDPRLFLANGRLGMIYAGLSIVSGDLHTRQVISVPGIAADQSGALPLSEWTLESVPGVKLSRIEKNWMPYDTGSGLDIIYRSSPFQRFTFHPGGNGELRTAPARALSMQGWEIRGGAPPVKVGENLWWHWFHGYRRDGNHYTYSTGVYEFGPERITRMTPGSVWAADARTDGANVTPDKTVIYPCGAFLENGTWFVSAGHQDSEILLGEFSHDEISNLMVHV